MWASLTRSKNKEGAREAEFQKGLWLQSILQFGVIWNNQSTEFSAKTAF
jgi:hypothetical protein